MKCIIVDDDELSRLAIEKCVKSNPILALVAVCSSGKEALDVIQKNDIDIIFLDVEMPEMSGIQLAARIREKLPRLPIVYVTGFTNDVNTDLESMESNERLLQKPFTALALVKKVREVLDQQHPSIDIPLP